MDLSKHLEKAAEATKRRNYPFAVNLYGQLLALQPDNGEARSGLREALFKKAEQKRPSRVVAMVAGGIHLLFATLARMLGKHGAAAKSLERYLVLDPLHEGSNLRLGDSLHRAGFKHSAAAVYRAFAQHDSRCLWAARGAGALLYETGELQGALAMYEQALKIDPRDQDSLKARKNLAAEGALKSSNIENVKSSRELIKDKTGQKQLEQASRLHLSADEVEKSLAKLEEQLPERPDDLGLLRQIADLREKRRDYEGASDCLDRVVQLMQSSGQTVDAELQSRMGDLRLRVQEQRVQEAEKSGDPSAADGARRVLLSMRVAEGRRRVKQQPTELLLRMDLGAALLEAGNLDEAIGELQQAVKDPRKKTEAQLLLGRAFRSKGLVDLAMTQLDKALESTSPNTAIGKRILYEMGTAAQDGGKAQDALRHFSRILEHDIAYKDVAQRVQNLKSAAAG